MWIIIVLILGVWLIGYVTKQSDANRQARANAKEMKKAFSSPSSTQSSPYKPTERTWRCSSCGHENSEKLNYCLHCRTDRYAVSSKIKCPHCGASNNSSNSTCFACQKSLTEEPSKAASTPAKPTENEQLTLIKQLAELHTKGILTDEEFETKKAELLSKM